MLKRLRGMLAAATATLALVAGLAPTQALAAPTIDQNATGSITVTKYDGADPDANGYQDATDAQATPGAGHKPLAGVTFEYLYVGGVAQTDEGGTVRIGFGVDSKTAAFLGLKDSDVDFTQDSQNYYASKTLQDALEAKTQTEVEDFLANGGATAMPATGADGTTKATGLKVGTYLVSEVSYPAEVDATSVRFFVTVPSPIANDQGVVTDWAYDVTANPKNRVTPTRVDKVIKGENGETKVDDAYVGQTKTFLVRADVPYMVGKLKSYRIEDTLSAGLDYQTGSLSVQGVKGGTRTQLTEGTDYTVTVEGKTVKIVFKNDSATFVDAQKHALYDFVEATYDVKLNKDAVVGDEGNPNDVRLVYSKTTNTDSGDEVTKTPTTLPTLYTYGVDLLKYGDGDENNKLAGVVFELRDDQGNAIKFTKDGDHYYRDDANGEADLTTDDNGKLVVQGIDAGSYTLHEKQTIQGYSLLGKDVAIQISSNAGKYHELDASDAGKRGAGEFAPVNAGQRYFADAAGTDELQLPEGVKDGQYVGFGTTEVWTGTPGNLTKVDMYTPDDLAWSATADGSTNLEMGEGGLAVVKVNNQKGFRLPQTGDLGGMLMVWGGAALAAVAFCLLVAGVRARRSGR